MSNQSETKKITPHTVRKHPQVSKLKTVAPSPNRIAEQTVFEAIDRVAHGNVAKANSGLAPSVLGEAWMDWAVHMAMSPGKQLQLLESLMRNGQALWSASLSTESDSHTADQSSDKRFASDAWKQYPFNLFTLAHRQNWQWWQDAMTDVHGVAPPHENLMAFVAGLAVDTTAPSNFPLTNPDVLSTTVAEGGQNLVRGAQHFFEDAKNRTGTLRPAGTQAFEVGRNLATTPGKVIYRNNLIELIQYTPTTQTVRPEPILIVPAWIMKYYILDLSPENSLISFLVGQGYTVFIVSWKNPDEHDRELGMEDYRKLGIMEAIDAVQAITNADKLHAVGYCLGGTLLSIAAAAMARDRDDRLATVTFLAAQIDFTEAGPLRLFISDSEVTMIEDMMAQQGYLSSEQMSAAFALLRARELVWAPVIRDYLLGQRGDAFDLMAWNADGTRMPARMRSEYLRKLFLDNDLAEGRYVVADRVIAVSDIRAPVFAVGTEDDHVAPWRSVYKLHRFVDTDMSFVLTSGGHNAGIVSEPGHKHRHFRTADTLADDGFRDPEKWLAQTRAQEGSWWPIFTAWLDERSGKKAPTPPMGNNSGLYKAVCDAPGTYVRQT